MSIYTTTSWELIMGIAYLMIVAIILIGLYLFLNIRFFIKNNEMSKFIIGIMGLSICCFLITIIFNHGNTIREATDYYKSNTSTIIDKKYSNGIFNDSYSIIAEIDVNGKKFQFEEYITENQYNLISIGDTWNYTKK